MRILDRYILRSVLGIFLGTVFTFAFLFILIDMFGNLEDFIEKHVSLGVLLQYYITFLPLVMVNTATMACLIATLFTYSQLNSNNEIIAARTSGLNFWHITRPPLIFALIVSAFVFLVNERFVPQSSIINQEIRDSQIKIAVAEKGKGRPLIKNLTFYGLKNRLFFVDSFDPNTNEISGVTIIGHDQNQNLVEKITAVKGKWTGIAWKFLRCQTTAYDSKLPNIPGEVKMYDEKLMDIRERPMDFIKQRLDLNAMNIQQLRGYIQRFSGSGAQKTITNLEVDYYQKIAFPFRTFIIVLAGLPFALLTAGKRKTATMASIAVALVIGFLYYVLDAVGLALGKGGGLAPAAAAFLAPGIFLAIALVAIKAKF